MEEREEGELSEGELSDISSEEEFLLRQRLQVLESYNHVLQKKEARRNNSGSKEVPAEKNKKCNIIEELHNSFHDDLSDISGSDLENSISLNIPIIKSSSISKKASFHNKYKKRYVKDRRTKSNNEKLKKYNVLPRKKSSEKVKLKSNTKSKKHSERKRLLDSSDETDDEYKYKRSKLQQSVQTNKPKTDQTSLKMRLLNMFGDKSNQMPIISETPENENKQSKEEISSLNDVNKEQKFIEELKVKQDKECIEVPELNKKEECTEVLDNTNNLSSFINLADISDRSACEVIIIDDESNNDLTTVDYKIVPKSPDEASDEDIELLRQNALQTKSQKIVVDAVEHISDSEDSEELRIICLRSKMLRNKIELRRKVKLRKKLAKISGNEETLESKLNELSDISCGGQTRDNTDIESVDMDIGLSDGPDCENNMHQVVNINIKDVNNSISKNVDNKLPTEEKEELDEDEDLLRAKLLTSLSNHFQKLYKPDDGEIIKNQENNDQINKNVAIEPNIPETQKIIINLGESDSGSENETTKNLKKMHQKLAENVESTDFQLQLDSLLKNARKETEKRELPVNVLLSKPPEKFVPKTVKHLPKSGQLEYKRLVRRMAELEKLKQNRQAILNKTSKSNKDSSTLKASSATELKSQGNKVDLETQIALSRKRIAAESAKVLRLKEESSKLAQKYKMVQAEMRNIRTAISLNKREVTSVQMSLTKMRNEHQFLVKRSVIMDNSFVASKNSYMKSSLSHSENIKEKITKNQFKSLTVCVINDKKNTNVTQDNTISVNLDVNTNKKTVTNKDCIKSVKNVGENVMNDDNNLRSLVITKEEKNKLEKKVKSSAVPTKEKKIDKNNEIVKRSVIEKSPKKVQNKFEDYVSPLASMKDDKWHCDPYGIMCPFDVSGACKDPDCPYQHPLRQIPTRP